MPRPNLFAMLVGVLSITAGCSTTNKIESLKPEPDNAAPMVYENATSFINLPITIRLKDIESQTNKVLSGLIYEDHNINDDDIELKIWKLAPLSISNENGKVKTVLPLKVDAKYRIGTNKLGVDLYNTREFHLNGKITLLSTVGMTNWKLNTQTNIKSIEWNESPTTTVLGKEVPITYLLNPAITLFGSKIEKSIDAAISKSADFKPNVLDALEQLSVPFQMSESYDSWLRIVPIELYATDAKLNKDIATMEMGLKCLMETYVGQQPVSKFDREKIILKPVSKMPNQITANIAAVSTYSDASRIMTKNFAGQQFGSGSKKVMVNNVNLWHKGGKMVIALDLSGSVNGTIYLAGFPQYNEITKEIYFDQLDYAFETKNKLMRTANWLASGVILRKIQESCRYSIQPNLDEGKQNLMKYLQNFSPSPGVFVNGKLGEIKFERIQLTNKAIVAFIKITGTANVKIDGIK